ncbi:hypothetical protein GSI_11217 [Ganoderma sinense ZZ0214-1]|uniref:CxC2-like cysteine cluster KDZ transposase-associated domain-containing protein n=1 Tax=Ganoderma sinense ZZ0214-1 TaxID=1077348 RepID=A0A2G8RYU9_9APHY|nr:hypothetical protein GSI_11217 [Ganoderma sinense ZZ0214-1]
MYDEASVELRQRKGGSRLVTKKSKVTFRPTKETPAGGSAHPSLVQHQAASVPVPLDIEGYNEVTFDDYIRPPRKGKSQNDFQRADTAADDLNASHTHIAVPLTPIALSPSLLPTAEHDLFDSEDPEADDEQVFLVEDPDSELEDEDGDFYYECRQELSVPTVHDLPWVGEAPRRPSSSSGTSSAPAATYGNNRMVVVVDLEGVHELPFTFCACPNAARDDLQLIDLGYYPASIRHPKTVFTTRLLDDFLLTNKECKTSARNYFNKLRRSTNPAFPHMVPDRYKELLRVSRQWRNLQMRKNAGFGHRAEVVGPGDLAIRCPACPQPDRNLPQEWQTDDHQWKYTRSVVLDSNFSAQHRKMRNPEDDVPLADGHGFMVTDAPYKEHLKTAAEFHERACKEWGPSVAAFEELTAGSDPAKCADWKREAEAADAARITDPAAMDIYDVATTPLPTRKEVQIMLAQQELNEGGDAEQLGVADWIGTGLRIEETKLAVAHAARRVKATSGTETRLSLVQQRQRLAASIAAFHKSGRKHMPGYLPGDGGGLETDATLFGAEWDEEVEAATDADPDVPADRPEQHPLGLPSTFGIEFLAQTGLLHLAEKERHLREGQLNDALQGIRTGIGYKSLLYRAKVRNASSYRAKLRSFDDVHVADEGVRKYVRVYQQARQAMEQLFDPDNVEDAEALAAFRTRYKDIRKEDLRVSTAAIESFTPRVRNEHSAWFWNVSDTERGEETQWIQDYRRMLWLRAYARKARWDEELELVPFEMDCTGTGSAGLPKAV